MSLWISPERKPIIKALVLLLSCFISSQAYAQTESCETVVHLLNSRLSPKIDERELIYILHSLNRTSNRQLPDNFITKKQARARGWRPGRNLWSVASLQGSSLGGDRFMNREHILPETTWREADLGYKGGRRGSKRLIFSLEGQRFVTVDHYRTFLEVPECSDR
jgi:ribonuclease T1